MPRTKRVLYDGAVYHIVQKGHNKGVLFKDAKDYNIFKHIICKYKKRYIFDIFHYCIMPNHIHILLKILKGRELPKIIQGITQSYSHYYKKVYSHVGYLYQNRYKSFLIESDSYLLDCGRYIERNPVRAGLVKDPAQYPWSSYNFYAQGRADSLLTKDPLYETLGKTEEERMRTYRSYVLETRPYENVLDEAVLKSR